MNLVMSVYRKRTHSTENTFYREHTDVDLEVDELGNVSLLLEEVFANDYGIINYSFDTACLGFMV